MHLCQDDDVLAECVSGRGGRSTIAELFLEDPEAEKLKEPNLQQAKFLKLLDADCVLTAPAGSGKTSTLVHAIRLCTVNMPEKTVSILSFSNASTDEIAEKMLGAWPTIYKEGDDWKDWKQTHLKTVHSFANTVCRKLFKVSEKRKSCMVATATHLLETHKEETQQWAKNLLILVDEAQDCNPGQMRFFEVLSKLGATMILIGDPRQAIFRFQGSRPEGMKEFSEGRCTSSLDLNHRSTPQIVALLNLIARGPYNIDTGLEGEDPQRAASTTRGPLPWIRYSRIQEYELRKENEGWSVVGEILDALRDPLVKSIAVLVRFNWEVDALHQNLYMNGIPCLARASKKRLGVNQSMNDKLRDAAFKEGVLVQVLNIHFAKGQEFDKVIVVLRGFATLDAAAEAWAPQSEEARKEDLTLLYVACSRAVTYLTIVITNQIAPFWVREVLKNAHAMGQDSPLRVGYLLPQPGYQCDLPRSQEAISVTQLVCEFNCADYIITHSLRGKRCRNQVACLETKNELAPAGGLCDGVPFDIGFEIEGGQHVLAQFGIAGIYGRAAECCARVHLLGERHHIDSVQRSLDFIDSIPLRTGVEGKELCRLAHTKEEFYQELVTLLLRRFQGFALGSDMRTFLATKNTASGWKLLRNLNDLLYVPGHKGDYCLGSSSSRQVTRIVERLERLMADETLMRQDAYSHIFRDRLFLFDHKSVMDIRETLIDAAERYLDMQERTPEVLGITSMLVNMVPPRRKFESADAVAMNHRPLPYLGNLPKPEDRGSIHTNPHVPLELRLYLKSCCLSPIAGDKVERQSKEVYQRLLAYHSPYEIDNATVEHFLDLDISALVKRGTRIPQSISMLNGAADICVGSGSNTSIIEIKAVAEVSVEDEAQVLLYAAMAKAKRAFLWDLRQGKLYKFELTEEEHSDIIQAAFHPNANLSVDTPAMAGMKRSVSHIVNQDDATANMTAQNKRSCPVGQIRHPV